MSEIKGEGPSKQHHGAWGGGGGAPGVGGGMGVHVERATARLRATGQGGGGTGRDTSHVTWAVDYFNHTMRFTESFHVPLGPTGHP